MFKQWTPAWQSLNTAYWRVYHGKIVTLMLISKDNASHFELWMALDVNESDNFSHGTTKISNCHYCDAKVYRNQIFSSFHCATIEFLIYVTYTHTLTHTLLVNATIMMSVHTLEFHRRVPLHYNFLYANGIRKKQ